MKEFPLDVLFYFIFGCYKIIFHFYKNDDGILRIFLPMFHFFKSHCISSSHYLALTMTWIWKQEKGKKKNICIFNFIKISHVVYRCYFEKYIWNWWYCTDFLYHCSTPDSIVLQDNKILRLTLFQSVFVFLPSSICFIHYTESTLLNFILNILDTLSYVALIMVFLIGYYLI